MRRGEGEGGEGRRGREGREEGTWDYNYTYSLQYKSMHLLLQYLCMVVLQLIL